jgi:hypothetical protein
MTQKVDAHRLHVRGKSVATLLGLLTRTLRLT